MSGSARVSGSADTLASTGRVDGASRRRRLGSGLLALPAVVWLIGFFVVPVLIVAVVSLGAKDEFGGVLFERLSFDNYARALDPTFWPTVANSFRYAAAATLLSIAIGYPIAYWISRYGGRRKGLLLLLVMLPFWTSYLIRTYAWMIILRDNGVVNSVLETVGIIDRPILLLNTDIAVIIGMTYGFLPFAILPLFVSIDRLDESIVQAARDLYASGRAAFVHVTLPLTMPGIVAASLLTFIPAIGDFVTPDLLGGAQTTTIAKIVQVFFLGARDWPMGAALGFILMAITVLGTLVALRTLRREIAGAAT